MYAKVHGFLLQQLFSEEGLKYLQMRPRLHIPPELEEHEVDRAAAWKIWCLVCVAHAHGTVRRACAWADPGDSSTDEVPDHKRLNEKALKAIVWSRRHGPQHQTAQDHRLHKRPAG